MWTVCAILGNVISPWIVNDTTNETYNDFLKNIKENAEIEIPKIRCQKSYMFCQMAQSLLTTDKFHWLERITLTRGFLKLFSLRKNHHLVF